MPGVIWGSKHLNYIFIICVFSFQWGDVDEEHFFLCMWEEKKYGHQSISFNCRGDWDKTVAASLCNGNKGVLPVRSSLPSWKTLISAKSANYFECVPDRVRIKVRPGRFWPGGPRKIPNAETNWTLSQSEEEPIQRRTRNSSKQDQRNELVRGFAAVSGGAEFEIQKRRWPFVSHVRLCDVEPSNSVLQICQLFRDKSRE